MAKLAKGAWFLWCFMLILGVQTAFAQKTGEKGGRIDLKRADFLGTNQRIDKDAKRIIGNVKLQQDDVFMYCDSVYLYAALNDFKAFGNVHLVKGDSIDVYSDTLYHFGNRRLSKFRGNVVMHDKRVKLYTDSLDYDMILNQAFYLNGGKIVDSSSVLESKVGRYYTRREQFFFEDSVVVKNESFDMFTDTLEYHSKTKMAYFRGPTTVVSDTNTIYAERGWYDLERDYGRIHKNARYSNNSQTLDCDTLYYDRNKRYGEAFSNVVMKSLTDSVVLTSNYAYYNEIDKSSLATDSATMIQISASDTLYMHADTLLSYVDSIDADMRTILAYYKVQVFSENIQMRCDSIAYSFRDSLIKLFGNPVMWSDSNQMKAKTIHFRVVDNELTDVYMKDNAIIITENDSIHYNQIKGFQITGHLIAHELQKAIVDRRSETIYYLEDEGQLTGMNKTRSRQMDVYFQEGKPHRIVWLSEPTGKVLPLSDLNPGNMFFNEFEWLDHLRPKERKDIYNWKPYVPKE
ncbi:MAG: OstA-like protein [Salinivirgaceae bacterium]